MSVVYETPEVTLHHGDCIDIMATLEGGSVDAIVTDPPYGLEFMGREWDGADGFRRSLNAADVGRESVFGRASRTSPEYRAGALFQEWCEAWAREALRVLKPGGHMLAFGGTRTWHRLAVAVEDAGFEIRDSIAWMYGSGFPKSMNMGGGLGTALKPAFEPVVVARKPLVGTVAGNLLEHGTGVLNIDASRIPHQTINGGNLADNPHLRGTKVRSAPVATGFGKEGDEVALTSGSGCFPANVLLDESQSARLDEARYFYTAKADSSERPVVDGVAHPTVKPLDLMRYLVRLVTPEGGTVLEPFAGSGTTLEAAVLEGFRCIGIERESDYIPLVTHRLDKPHEVGFDLYGAA